MTRIFDNIDEDLLGTLRGSMRISKCAELCVECWPACRALPMRKFASCIGNVQKLP